MLGSAIGGHYYAYVKSFEKGKWYNFNDSSVHEISENDIQYTFGNETAATGYSSCAYMLMYRRIDSTRNINTVAASEVPKFEPSTKKQNGDNGSKEEEDTMLVEDSPVEDKPLDLKVYYQGKAQTISILKSESVLSLLQILAEKFSVDLSNFANVRISDYDEKLGEYFMISCMY